MKFTRNAIRLYCCLYFISLFLHCTNAEPLNAYIFERKRIDDDQLLIKYKYSVNSKEFIDSATVKNTVLLSDTITISIDANNPGKSKLKLEQKQSSTEN